MNKIELSGDGLDGARVMAWMCFPDSPEMRQTLLAREILENLVADQSSNAAIVSAPVWVLQCLVSGTSHHEMRERAGEAAKRGTVAGDLLGLMYRMHFEEVEEPSFRKAIADYRRFAIGGKYGDGTPLKYSEQTLRTYFDEFESVAHLWAAYRLNQTKYRFTPDKRNFFRDTEALSTCLGVAKGVAEFAATFVPKRWTKPVIEASLMVQIPDEIDALRLRKRPNHSSS